MTSTFLQEKMEFLLPKPTRPANNNEWQDQKDTGRKVSFSDSLNKMPILDLEEESNNTFLPLTFAGTRSEDSCTTSESIVKGYVRQVMLPTDDNYQGEHAEPFYGEIEGEAGVGFVERNNVCDRY